MHTHTHNYSYVLYVVHKHTLQRKNNKFHISFYSLTTAEWNNYVGIISLYRPSWNRQFWKLSLAHLCVFARLPFCHNTLTSISMELNDFFPSYRFYARVCACVFRFSITSFYCLLKFIFLAIFCSHKNKLFSLSILLLLRQCE